MEIVESPVHRIGRYYAAFARLANHGQPVVLLLIRLYIGYQCALSGWGHLSHFHQTVDVFRNDWHVPMPEINVAVSATTELIGGILLAVGFLTRLVSLPLIGNFTVAILVANLSDPKYADLLKHFWNHQDIILKDDAFPFLVTAILMLFFGPGPISIDGLIARTIMKKPEQRGFAVTETPGRA